MKASDQQSIRQGRVVSREHCGSPVDAKRTLLDVRGRGPQPKVLDLRGPTRRAGTLAWGGLSQGRVQGTQAQHVKGAGQRRGGGVGERGRGRREEVM